MTDSISCSDILKLLLPSDIKIGRKVLGFKYIEKHAESLGLTCKKSDTNIVDNFFSRKDNVILGCDACGFTSNITASSLLRRSNGCPRCNSITKWEYRVEELEEICRVKEVKPCVDLASWDKIPDKLALECTVCTTKFDRTLENLIRGKTHCPTCHPPPVLGKMGVKSMHGNVEFASKFELDVYNILLEKLDANDIKLQVHYTELGIVTI